MQSHVPLGRSRGYLERTNDGFLSLLDCCSRVSRRQMVLCLSTVTVRLVKPLRWETR